MNEFAKHNRPERTAEQARAYEIALLHVSLANDFVERLRRLHNLTGLMILGEIVAQEPQQGHDGFNVYTAALSLDRGVGAAIVDLDEMLAATRRPDTVEDMMKQRFVPFDRLSAPHQVLLRQKTGDLLSRLFNSLPLVIECGS